MNDDAHPGQVNLKSYFVYPMPVTIALPILVGTDTQQFQIEAATDFFWIKSTYTADIAGAAQTEATRIVPNTDVQLQSTGNDKNLFNNFVPIPSVFGTGQLPYVLPFPFKLQANSLLRADFLNREAVSTPFIRLAFHGWKDYGWVDAA